MANTTLADARKLIADKYTARQARTEHPDGTFDKGLRWNPSEDERCECCGSVRTPSRAYPWSMMAHCRTRKHVQALLRKQGKI